MMAEKIEKPEGKAETMVIANERERGWRSPRQGKWTTGCFIHLLKNYHKVSGAKAYAGFIRRCLASLLLDRARIEVRVY